MLIAISLSSCGGLLDLGSNGKNEKSESSSSSYRYEFESNRCKTGKHTFDNLSDYCNALKSRSLNMGCAYKLREAEYNRQCSGVFFENE